MNEQLYYRISPKVFKVPWYNSYYDKVTSSLVVVLNLRLHNYYDREIVCTQHIITLSTPLSTYKFSRLILYIHLFIYLLSFASSWQCHRNGALSGANYCRPVTVPSPMRDWPPHRGPRPLLFMNSAWVLSCPTEFICARVGRWAYSLSSLSEKTRECNHLQMSLQRLSYFSSVI